MIASAFSKSKQTNSEFVYTDNFESYLTTAQMDAAYTIWQDGAIVHTGLEKDYFNSGSKSMRVDVVGPNPNTHATNASIYHLLSSGENDWRNGIGMRLWINNTSKYPLSFTLNFKEKYNEFWAVSRQGRFYLESSDGDFSQQEIQYGNLAIPAYFQGYLYIPFDSFSVPSWNTAKGDGVMDLSAIDSFSFGVNVTINELQRFYVDDIQVVSSLFTQPATISGLQVIQIPESGEHREQYTAHFPEILNLDITQAVYSWSIRSYKNPNLSISQQGWLTIPAGTQAGDIMLVYNLTSGDKTLQTSYRVTLIDPQTGVIPTETVAAMLPIQTLEASNSGYIQFADNFDQWVSSHRVLFVILSVSALMVLIGFLAYLQSRLK